MNKKAQEYLDSYGFNYIDATKVIDDYNFEDRKLVEIVKSTYFNPKVLVVDETTTALGQKGREELFKVMHKVRDTGNCVIFISLASFHFYCIFPLRIVRTLSACSFLLQGLIQSVPFYVLSVHRTILHLICIGMSPQSR